MLLKPEFEFEKKLDDDVVFRFRSNNVTNQLFFNIVKDTDDINMKFFVSSNIVTAEGEKMIYVFSFFTNETTEFIRYLPKELKFNKIEIIDVEIL